VATATVSAQTSVVREVQSQRTVTFDTPARIPAPTELGSKIDEVLKQEKLTREAQQTLEDDVLSLSYVGGRDSATVWAVITIEKFTI
jgi:hypothetical protein